MPVVVGVVQVRFRLDASSLKDKRSVVKSIVERVRIRFRVTAAEVADLESLTYATVAAAVVSNDSAQAGAVLQHVARFVESERLDVQVISLDTEIIRL